MHISPFKVHNNRVPLIKNLIVFGERKVNKSEFVVALNCETLLQLHDICKKNSNNTAPREGDFLSNFRNETKFNSLGRDINYITQKTSLSYC
jgi:hypothetical protein